MAFKGFAYIRDKPDGVEIKTPYHQDWLDDLKRIIPSGARKWLPERMVWWVASKFKDEALEICKEYFQVVFENEEGKPRAPKEGNYRALFLIPGAPKELVKAAYRSLALLYHPDKGGDGEKMKEINEAYNQLKEG